MGRYIAVAGNMGSGKTSLVDFLQRRYRLWAAFEPNEENPYLADFYKDMERWSLHSQLFFLERKVSLHYKLQAHKGVGLLDRTIYEDAEIFARNLHLGGQMSRRDYHLYRDIYRKLIKQIEPPSLLIFLRCRIEALKERIAQRGRAMENAVPDEYLMRLNRIYGQWPHNFDYCPVIEIRTDKIDYISDLTHQIDLLKAVELVLEK